MYEFTFCERAPSRHELFVIHFHNRLYGCSDDCALRRAVLIPARSLWSRTRADTSPRPADTRQVGQALRRMSWHPLSKPTSGSEAASSFAATLGDDAEPTSQLFDRSRIAANPSAYRPGRAPASRARSRIAISARRGAARLAEDAAEHEGEKNPEKLAV